MQKSSQCSSSSCKQKKLLFSYTCVHFLLFEVKTVIFSKKTLQYSVYLCNAHSTRPGSIPMRFFCSAGGDILVNWQWNRHSWNSNVFNASSNIARTRQTFRMRVLIEMFAFSPETCHLHLKSARYGRSNVFRRKRNSSCGQQSRFLINTLRKLVAPLVQIKDGTISSM